MVSLFVPVLWLKKVSFENLYLTADKRPSVTKQSSSKVFFDNNQAQAYSSFIMSHPSEYMIETFNS